MKINCHFDHFNINVSDLKKSIEFYETALNLKVSGEIRDPEGEFIITYMTAPEGDFRLELTWLRTHPQQYDLGENESHLAVRIDEDNYEAIKTFHRNSGFMCFDNPQMGVYFIHDPDDYWIEVLSKKK